MLFVGGGIGEEGEEGEGVEGGEGGDVLEEGDLIIGEMVKQEENLIN